MTWSAADAIKLQVSLLDYLHESELETNTTHFSWAADGMPMF
jgi:hypothetical protein